VPAIHAVESEAPRPAAFPCAEPPIVGLLPVYERLIASVSGVHCLFKELGPKRAEETG
jgi:hypothetical protein